MPNIDLIWEEGSGKYCTHPIVFHSSYNLYLICMSLVGKWVRRGEREREKEWGEEGGGKGREGYTYRAIAMELR